eukprot:gene8476-11458_t
MHAESNKPSSLLALTTLYGVIGGLMCVPITVSFCSIIFRDAAFESFMPLLVKLVLFSSAIHQICFCIFSSLPFAVGQVQDAGLIFLSAMAGSVATGCTAMNNKAAIVPTTLFTLAISTSTLGLMLIAVSKMKLASVIQYLPMPVIGGYLAFIGFFCGEAGLQMMAGVANSADLFASRSIILLLPGVVAGGGMYVLLRTVKSPFVLPVCMILVLVIFYCVLLVTNTSLEQARNYGWISPLSPSVAFYSSWLLFDVRLVEWSLLPRQIFRLLGMFLVVAFSSSLDVAAIEMELGLPLDYDRELNTVGISNLASGILGGYTGSYIFTQTIFNMRRGVQNRLCGYIIAAIEIAMILNPISIICILPKMFFGSLLILISIDLLQEWLIAARKKMMISEYIVCLLTFAAIKMTEIETGMLIGIIFAMISFVITYAKLQTVSVATLQTSTVIRTFEERAALMNQKGKVVTISLKGYIFFGSAVRILEEVKSYVVIRQNNVSNGEEFRSSPIIDSNRQVHATPPRMKNNVSTDSLVTEEFTPLLMGTTITADGINSIVKVHNNRNHSYGNKVSESISIPITDTKKTKLTPGKNGTESRTNMISPLTTSPSASYIDSMSVYNLSEFDIQRLHQAWSVNKTQPYIDKSSNIPNGTQKLPPTGLDKNAIKSKEDNNNNNQVTSNGMSNGHAFDSIANGNSPNKSNKNVSDVEQGINTISAFSPPSLAIHTYQNQHNLNDDNNKNKPDQQELDYDNYDVEKEIELETFSNNHHKVNSGKNKRGAFHPSTSMDTMLPLRTAPNRSMSLGDASHMTSSVSLSNINNVSLLNAVWKDQQIGRIRRQHQHKIRSNSDLSMLGPTSIPSEPVSMYRSKSDSPPKMRREISFVLNNPPKLGIHPNNSQNKNNNDVNNERYEQIQKPADVTRDNQLYHQPYLYNPLEDEDDSSVHGGTEYLILDFTGVLGVDATAARSCFLMLVQLMRAAGVTVIFAQMSESIEQLFRAHNVINEETQLNVIAIPLLDDALEWCEEQVLFSAENQPVETTQVDTQPSTLLKTPRGLKRDIHYYTRAWQQRQQQTEMKGRPSCFNSVFGVNNHHNNGIISNDSFESISIISTTALRRILLDYLEIEDIYDDNNNDKRVQEPLSSKLLLSRLLSTSILTQYFKRITFESRELIYDRGQTADKIYFIEKGAVEIVAIYNNDNNSQNRTNNKNNNNTINTNHNIHHTNKNSTPNQPYNPNTPLSFSIFHHRASPSNNYDVLNENDDNEGGHSSTVQRVNKVSSGGVFGEADFILGRKHGLRAYALSPGSLWTLNRQSLSDMEVREPQLCMLLQHTLLKSLAMAVSTVSMGQTDQHHSLLQL